MHFYAPYTLKIVKTCFSQSSCSKLSRLSMVSLTFQNLSKFRSLHNDLKPQSAEDMGHASCLEKIRCDESNPGKHTLNDIPLMYTVPVDHYNRMASAEWNTKCFNIRFQRLCKTFHESCVMIRKPGIELTHYLKNSVPDKAVNRYILYGKNGAGKSMILQYAIHYGISNNWLVIPTYHLWDCLKYKSTLREKQKQEAVVSQYDKSKVDQPGFALRWLETFQLLNQPLLNNIHTTRKYVWSKHDSTEAGTPLGALVDVGKSRPRNSTDVIGCIMREVRVQDHTTMPPVLVAVDCINAAFGKTLLKIEQGVYLQADQLSFVSNLKKLLSNNWKNGAVVGAVDGTEQLRYSNTAEKLDKEHPYDLLGREGFDWLDPHVLIHVPLYNDLETLTHLAYYKDRKWLVGKSLTAHGEAEIMQLCGGNANNLVNMCAGLF